jgi:hypothetical protein
MILKIAQDRKFPEEEVNQLIRNPEPIDTLGALSNDQKFSYLMDCLDLIFADQKVFESEIIFTKSIAIKLGFKKNVVDYLLENINKKPVEEIKLKVFAEYW